MTFIEYFRGTILFFFLCLCPLLVYSNSHIGNIRYDQCLKNISEKNFITLMSEYSRETLQVITEFSIGYVKFLEKLY